MSDHYECRVCGTYMGHDPDCKNASKTPVPPSRLDKAMRAVLSASRSGRPLAIIELKAALAEEDLED